MTNVLRTLADGLINKAEELPRESASAGHLRDAAASLLDADSALEREALPLESFGIRAIVEVRR